MKESSVNRNFHMYRNFYFIYAGYTMYGIENPPLLRGGA